jgi:ParB-like chromosome segregation protein Spo0J
METDLPLEVIGGYKVHPAASFFPLIEGEEFDALVMSIKTVGLMNPIVLKNGMLIDGRNRLRAILELQSNHSSIVILTKELEADVKSVSEYIFDTNIQRRHLTTDQRAMIGYQILPLIQQDREAKQVATQFKAGNKVNPSGKAKEPVDVKPHPPAPRDIKQKNEQSTVGQIAKVSKVSQHKGKQVVAVAKAIEAGKLPKETIAKVSAGTVKLKDVAPKPIPKRDIMPEKKEWTRDMKLELALSHMALGMDEYMSVEYASVRLLELASNAKIDLLKRSHANEVH